MPFCDLKRKYPLNPFHQLPKKNDKAVWHLTCKKGFGMKWFVLSCSTYLLVDGWWTGILVIKVRHRYQPFEWYNEQFFNITIPDSRPHTTYVPYVLQNVFQKIFQNWMLYIQIRFKIISRQPWNMAHMTTPQ